MTPGGPHTCLCPPAWASTGPFLAHRFIICVIFSPLSLKPANSLPTSPAVLRARAIVPVPQGPEGMCAPHSPRCATAEPTGQLATPTSPRQGACPVSQNLHFLARQQKTLRNSPWCCCSRLRPSPCPPFPALPKGLMMLLRPGQMVPAGPSAPSPGLCRSSAPVPASPCTSALCTSAPAHLLLHVLHANHCSLHICPVHIPCFVPMCLVPTSKGSEPVARSQRAEVAMAGSSTLGTAAAPSNTQSPHAAPQPRSPQLWQLSSHHLWPQQPPCQEELRSKKTFQAEEPASTAAHDLES